MLSTAVCQLRLDYDTFQLAAPFLDITIPGVGGKVAVSTDCYNKMGAPLNRKFCAKAYVWTINLFLLKNPGIEHIEMIEFIGITL